MPPVSPAVAALGTPCPDFSLPATDGKTYCLTDWQASKLLLVVLTCNHCPYAKAIEDRVVVLANSYTTEQLQVVAISSNDATAYPDDSFAKMQERAIEKRFPFPYLYDESQDVARAFDAVCTPDFLLYDDKRQLAYRGRLDDNWKEPEKVTKQELKDAIDAILTTGIAPTEQRVSLGCSIKWKKDV